MAFVGTFGKHDLRNGYLSQISYWVAERRGGDCRERAYILEQGEAGRRIEIQHVPEPAGFLDFGLDRVAFEGDFDWSGVAVVVLR